MKNEEFSDNKLRELLDQSKLAQSFKVPDGYFEGLSENVMHSINSLPDFEKTPSIQPFEVPVNYFEKLPSLINDRITSRSETGFSLWSWIFKPSRFIPAAFSIALFIGGYFYFTRIQVIDLNDNTCTIEEINESQYLQSINDNDIIDFLATEQDNKVIDEYDQYLLDNNIDISQLEKNL